MAVRKVHELRVFPVQLRYSDLVKSLSLVAQDVPFDHPDCGAFFKTEEGRPIEASASAIALYSYETIIECCKVLSEFAALNDGVLSLQRFQSSELEPDQSDLWLYECCLPEPKIEAFLAGEHFIVPNPVRNLWTLPTWHPERADDTN